MASGRGARAHAHARARARARAGAAPPASCGTAEPHQVPETLGAQPRRRWLCACGGSLRRRGR
eukprot:6642055-Prymnesium_polylepis.1